jgi:hypothetical protein
MNSAYQYIMSSHGAITFLVFIYLFVCELLNEAFSNFSRLHSVEWMDVMMNDNLERIMNRWRPNRCKISAYEYA